MATTTLPSLEEMLEAGVHFGHQTNKWHPGMKKFIFDAREGIHVINLEDTYSQLEKAFDFIAAHIRTTPNPQIVFIGTKRQAAPVVREKAIEAGVFHVTNRWPGGLITNFNELKRAIKHYNELGQVMKDAKQMEALTTKNRYATIKEHTKLGVIFEGVSGLTKPPTLLVIIDPRREKTAINEARLKNIPTIGIIDTNTDPSLVDLPIPANDDALKSIELILGSISKTVQNTRLAQKEKDDKKNEDTKE